MIHLPASLSTKKIYKPKYQHSSLVGYVGYCKKCGSEKRLYLANNNGEVREMIEGGIEALNSSPNLRHRDCVNCVSRSHIEDSIVFVKLLSKEKVQKDLDCILENGIGFIDVKKGKEEMIFQSKEEREYEDFIAEQEERKARWSERNNI